MKIVMVISQKKMFVLFSFVMGWTSKILLKK